MNNAVFDTVAGATIERSLFDLSHEVKFSADMGLLYPVMCEEMIPGDVFDLSHETVVRFSPLMAPIMHEINIYFHTFFVPTRLMMKYDEDGKNLWEQFIQMGDSGDKTITLPEWQPTKNGVGSLWDYFGFPVDIDPKGMYPVDFPRIGYNMIWNEYYRDRNLQKEEIPLTNEDVLRVGWEKDYFVSALPWRQRGVAPSIPISGKTSAVFNNLSLPNLGVHYALNGGIVNLSKTQNAGSPPTYSTSNNLPNATTNSNLYATGTIPASELNNNVVDLSTASAIDVAQLRTLVRLQEWFEMNARAGSYYKDFLQAHFGVSPSDARLQRPEYIGGSQSPVIISEVRQQTPTDTSPLGQLGGHGITADMGYIGKYRAEEFGYIFTLMSVKPKPSYQQGINRQWLRKTPFDFYFNMFANLSEQGIHQAEIMASNDENENLKVFGFTGIYNEMRYKPNRVSGLLRKDFSHWHLGRIFDSSKPPRLNSEFIECNPSKRVFAVPSQPSMVITQANIIKAVRPIPRMPIPSL